MSGSETEHTDNEEDNIKKPKKNVIFRRRTSFFTKANEGKPIKGYHAPLRSQNFMSENPENKRRFSINTMHEDKHFSQRGSHKKR